MSSIVQTSTVLYELQDLPSSSLTNGKLQGIGPSSTAKTAHATQTSTSGQVLGASLQPLTHASDARLVDELPTTPSPGKKTRAIFIIFQVSFVNFLCSFVNGMITIGLPRIAVDLQLPERLYLWPSSVFGLTTGSTLLLAGAIADVIGARNVDLLGCTLLGAFTLGCGLSSTGIQLVMFRAFQGIGSAMHVPCSVSLVTKYVASGKGRNIGFACLGLSMPMGFFFGLFFGGILVDTIGWRVGFYLCGAILVVLSVVGLKIIPADERPENVLLKMKTEIDWVGALTACAGLAMFSYVLALLSTSGDNIRQSSAITMLVISIVLMAFFPFWMHLQQKKGRPALVPNHLWKNLPFSCVCVVTILTWGVMNSFELFSSLYFQEVQELPALQASLRILPGSIIGTLLNLTTGYFVDRAPVFWLVLITTTMTAGSPLIMALINPHLLYWKGAFFAQVLAPLSGDVLFTVGLIIVSEVFPERTQALAGAVFNTVAYFGMSLGLNLMQVVSLLVNKTNGEDNKTLPTTVLPGYRASFWAMFAATMTCAFLIVLGLRKMGSIGLKRD